MQRPSVILVMYQSGKTRFLFLFLELEMPFAKALDFREFFARAAKPDMNIGILDADFLGEVGDFHS